jgi:hypothetical protein
MTGDQYHSKENLEIGKVILAVVSIATRISPENTAGEDIQANVLIR